ncbi:dihydrofolate reductase family protein [Nocardia cyriacigeorgica]|uniref:Dihydrofolate reductase family protein n=1 Tax=Nocardia cyriacigeorgica TaxID=135487 RepID=A0A6P1D8H8_9NOCA|nr:dihydrofolate reductase family protein [Nocardia cyriacigeorgica]NEW40632.1 dihydrofolate reductase family protein [Nocardia cyriacigeorgica]NEW45103.1 dihydrofolate reductase family protein [Nocardia cyriacigeorgica]NEW51140.1 dihydrofolate reductase family protein [Nocardia cyriacigeorgica]NEW54275.1 dihydrofolate reductase family protein [Nocardia cyriacigeorgica]
MELSLTQFVTLDGVYQAPGGPEEDPAGGFTQGGWLAPFIDDEFGAYIDAVFDRADAFLLGRRTYDIFAGYWPKITDSDDVVPVKLNALPKFVVSTHLDRAEWSNTEILRGDLITEVSALKDRPGREVQLHGSGSLGQSLLAARLVDTVYLVTAPIVLGHGKRLFTDGLRPTGFRLTESRASSTGLIMSTYRMEGVPEYGLVGE